jgi:hypothetical protein
MKGVTIQIQDRNVREAIGRLTSPSAARGLRSVVGRAGRNLLKSHLLDLNTRRHRFGRGFYAQAARGVNFISATEGVLLSINQVGIRQRYYGGLIKPGPGKQFLTIPNEDEPAAFQSRAREIGNLVVRKEINPATGRLQWCLEKALPHQEILVRKRKNGAAYIKRGRTFAGGEVYYWLVRSVNQKPDPGVLPPGFVIMQAATAAAAEFLKLQWSREQGGAATS